MKKKVKADVIGEGEEKREPSHVVVDDVLCTWDTI